MHDGADLTGDSGQPQSSAVKRSRDKISSRSDATVVSTDRNGCPASPIDEIGEPRQRLAAAIARAVEGVKRVDNRMTCGAGAAADVVTKRLLENLDDEWHSRREKTALAQADYLRWALWLIYRFRIPPKFHGDTTSSAVCDAVEQALKRVADIVRAPKALLATQMLQLAGQIHASLKQDAPETENAQSVPSRKVDGNRAMAAAQSP